ncbi:MAG TPA: Hsp33 family molecular chaperone HslO, partial [Pseudomonadales bacterium]|nr:Hsp33 family molecular chaperone HslO [Pseudomonadales bacterium]
MFEHGAARGEIVHLHETYQHILARQAYPLVLQAILGELTAAAVIMSATLKFEGVMVIQARGNGPVSLLAVECTHDKNIRAVARWEGELSPASSLKELLGDGYLVITIDPTRGERYQGIVALEKETLAACLEDYFQNSEQLPTKIWLASGNGKAAGMLLQILPSSSGEKDEDAWHRTLQLANTVTTEELLSLDAEILLYRLFHEEQVRGFGRQSVQFQCSCSRERTATMLKNIGKEEVESILADHGAVEINCEFCGASYRFDSIDVSMLFR